MESAIYDKIYSKQSNAWRVRRLPFYNKLASFINETDTVLDLGCGNGLLAKFSKWKKYIGVDFSEVAINQAKIICPEGEFICADINTFKPGKYDIIVLTEMLEHMENDKELLNKVNSGARVLISVPNDEKLIDGKPAGCRLHVRNYTLRGIRKRYNMIKFSKTFVFEKWIIGIGTKK